MNLHDLARTLGTPTLILMQGSPGSGKSSIAGVLATILGCPIVSLDAIRGELCGNVNDQSRNAEVLEIAEERCEQILLTRSHVILDSTLAQRAWLHPWLKLGRKTGADIRILRVHVPLEVALIRNTARERVIAEDRLRQFYSDVQQFDDSGIHHIITIIDNR